MSLKEIKGRIASIQSTQKITSAMRMVASAKLHRTQGMTQNFLCYMDSLHSILDSLSGSLSSGTSQDEQADVAVKGKKVLLISISSNSGLCGAFNSNISKETFKHINLLKANGSEAIVVPVGKKIAHELKKENIPFEDEYVNLMEKVERGEAIPLIAEMMNAILMRYEKSEIDAVQFVFHHFKSMGRQVITVKNLLLQKPVIRQEGRSSNADDDEECHFLTEPSAQELADSIFPRLINAETYGTLLDSLTSEHASRMLAMQTADDNANELLKELTLLYNKTRQQAITNELIDIMGGKVQ